MAGKSSGAETPATATATGTPEPVSPPADSAAQEPNVIQELEAARARMAEFATAQDKLVKERNDAIAARLVEEAKYKGLQFQTTQTLQKAAEDRRALAAAQIQAAEIGDIKSLLSTLASKVLDEDENKDLQWKQKDLELQRREAQIVARAAEVIEQPVATPQQYTTPEDEKAQFLSYYFPNVEVDSSDPNIDWGVGASSTQEAFRRFTTSVLKIKDSKEQTKANDVASTLQKQATEQLAAIQKQQDELAAKTAQEIADAKAAAIEEARKEAEKRLRAMGADVNGASPSDGGPRTLKQQVEETLDDSLLRTKKGQEEYARRVEAIGKQFKERFR